MNHNTVLSIIMLSLLPVISQGRELAVRTVGIETGGREMKMKVLEPKEADGRVPGRCWRSAMVRWWSALSTGSRERRPILPLWRTATLRWCGCMSMPMNWASTGRGSSSAARALVGDSRRRYASTPGTRGRFPSPSSCRSIRCWTARTRHHRPTILD